MEAESGDLKASTECPISQSTQSMKIEINARLIKDNTSHPSGKAVGFREGVSLKEP